MSHSNSSLNCFASCMSKYEQNYILHNKPSKISPHLTFGVMAHDTLYKAGKLRDDSLDGVISKEDYYSVIPSEVLYNDLKQTFGITNWQKYFTPVIKKTCEYETKLIKELSQYGEVTVEREVKLQATIDDIKKYFTGCYNINQPIVGIIDCLIRTENHAVILDYKFSSHSKTQNDFDMNSQLQLYAFLVHNAYDIDVRNIQIGYIDIPKETFGMPSILTNGTLSRAKSQNVSQENYAMAVKAVHGDDPYYNCEPGGYYHDIYNELALKQPAYLSLQYVDTEIYSNVTYDLIKTANTIDYFTSQGMPFLRKYDSYSCSGCEYLNTCKPYLGMEEF